MQYSDFLKTKEIKSMPIGFDPLEINDMLFDFQKDIVSWSCRRGKSAIFADCGLGKTIMQLDWAHNIQLHTQGMILILAPLAVAKQTKREGAKFGYEVNICESQEDCRVGINITNYEKLHRFTAKEFSGVVLDESSIIKSFSGKIRNQIIEMFAHTRYKLACTATPSPNDFEELGNHAEFLGISSRSEMLSMFFINDTANTGTWRLKGHAEDKFWSWICSWAVMIRKPSDLGYADEGFDLPDLNMIGEVISSDENGPQDGLLFGKLASTLSERRNARKESLNDRVQMAADLVNNSDEQWLVWCDLNTESESLTRQIKGAVEVKGADTIHHKESAMMEFGAGDIKCLVTKSKIAGFGMNWQQCHNMIFVGLSDSYEAFYQSVRRCWRFGQKQTVNAYIITSEKEGAVVNNIRRKEADAMKMAEGMTRNMSEISSKMIHGDNVMTGGTEYGVRVDEGDNWKMYNADCVEIVSKLPSDSIHYSLFSPPFQSLFTYSASERDMGNCSSEKDFYDHFQYLVKELYRVMMPGRILSFHVMNLPSTITHDGYIGMKDFRGDLIRVFQSVGFVYYSEVCIWKDPLVQATRTKTLTLAHKQISKDSARCSQGYPDYIVCMRKPGDNPEPVSKGRGFETYIGDMASPPEHEKTDDPRTNKFSHHVWQRYASPVWFDINQTRTLNERAARTDKDEKHMCPLQLDTIDRCIELWSNPGDTVLSPFGGIGSEGYGALGMKRKFIGIELKPSYYDQAVKNLQEISRKDNQMNLFYGGQDETTD